MEKRYQLRKAAGNHWLLDMQQSGRSYNKPVPLNESGARIWRSLADGEEPEQIAGAFSAEYGITAGQALEDIRQFMEQLEKQGIK